MAVKMEIENAVCAAFSGQWTALSPICGEIASHLLYFVDGREVSVAIHDLPLAKYMEQDHTYLNRLTRQRPWPDWKWSNRDHDLHVRQENCNEYIIYHIHRYTVFLTLFI